MFSSEITVRAKFLSNILCQRRMKFWFNGQGSVIKMAAIPLEFKNNLNVFFLEPKSIKTASSYPLWMGNQPALLM